MVDLQATSRAGEESRPSGRDECSVGQPVASARPGTTLDVRLLAQALVLVRHQVGLDLGNEVHDHHHTDRKSIVSGKRVSVRHDLGGIRNINIQKKTRNYQDYKF